MAPDCLRQAVQRHLVDWRMGSAGSNLGRGIGIG